MAANQVKLMESIKFTNLIMMMMKSQEAKSIGIKEIEPNT